MKDRKPRLARFVAILKRRLKWTPDLGPAIKV